MGQPFTKSTMQNQILANYLRTYRRRSGLSQRELSFLLGYEDRGQVPRHEQFATSPPLSIALAYEAIYRVPVSTLFLGMHDTVRTTVEQRLATLEEELQGRSAKDHDAGSTAQKLEWLTERQER
jgi:transcriptional regulator with XRE-family HTH domain